MVKRRRLSAQKKTMRKKRLTKAEAEKMGRRLGISTGVALSGIIITPLFPPVGVGMIVVGTFDMLSHILNHLNERGHKVHKVEKIGKHYHIHYKKKK